MIFFDNFFMNCAFHEKGFWEHVRHKMTTFLQKMSKKWSPKIMQIVFCYGKTLFAKRDKVAELTFFGADFQRLWSTLCP